MPFLVDTNVLLRSVDINHPMNADAANAIDSLLNQGEQLCIVTQNLIEFWNYGCESYGNCLRNYIDRYLIIGSIPFLQKDNFVEQASSLPLHDSRLEACSTEDIFTKLECSLDPLPQWATTST